MKTFKFLSFVSMFLLLSSCDSLSDMTSKTVEVKAPAIDFSIGGLDSAPQQKVSATEVEWFNKQVDIKTPMQTELEKNSLSISNIKTLDIIASEIDLSTVITKAYDLGDIKIYVNDVVVAHGIGVLSPTVSVIAFQYTSPFSIFTFLDAGTVQMKITSTAPKPDIKFDMKLLNTYSSKISLF